MDVWGLLVNVATAGVASGGFHFLFKEGIKARLKKEVESDLARLRNDLEIKKEVIKNDLQKEAYKAQLLVTNVHQIYPELVAKLEIAMGAVGSLCGFTFAVDLRGLNEQDIATFLQEQKLPKGKQEEFLAKCRTSKDAGIKAIQEHLRELEYTDARHKCVEAKNYRILKSIYCADDVLAAFDECYKCIWSAWADLHVGRLEHTLFTRGMTTVEKDVPKNMEAFRKAIRSELRVGE